MIEKYVRKIIRKLHCSRARKKELRKQLMSDMQSALEQGETQQDIIERMGSPIEIAADFNQGFTKEELTKYKREKWLKWIAIILVVLVVLAAVIYWLFPKAKRIEESETFEQGNVQVQAEQAVRFLNAGNYDKLQQMATDKMRPFLTKEKMEPALEATSSDWGEFKSFGNSYISEISQQGKQYAIIELSASYENISVVYTITFDDEMKLAGLYMR